MVSLAFLLGVAAIVWLIVVEKTQVRPYDHERDGI